MTCSIKIGLLSGLFALSCLTGIFAVETAPNRGKIDLDGTWSFATDPQEIGESEEWFRADKALPVVQPEGYAPKVPGEIQVPGIWDNQGYGTTTDKVKHNFVGKAWYKRTVAIPQNWDGHSIYLTLTGISRYAKVWVNGQCVGKEAIGCIGKHEWDVSPFLQPGQDACITIRVDSRQRWDIDPLLGAASLNDYLEIKWGGIWGHVFLEARPKTRLDSFYLRSDIASSTCRVETTVLNELKEKSCDSLKLEIFDKDQNCVAAQTESLDAANLTAETFDASIAAVIPDAKLWSPDTPYLYRVRLSLLNGEKIIDVLESSYGMREIKIEGSRILLNGKRLFLNGYGDDHIYPIEFSMPTNREMYVERMKIIKSFGFNHVRHHSCILPHEYYDVCDELGMFPNAEMLLGYPQQLPSIGQLWKANVPEGTSPEPALETLRERWATVVKEYRNHPSIFLWIGGNELSMIGWDLWLEMPLRYQYQEIANRLDPDRYFCDDDGEFLRDLNTRGERDTLAVNMILFDEWSNPLVLPEKFKTDKLVKPGISHESGNYVTFARPDQIELFENSNYLPFWMVDGVDKLKQLGLMDEAENWSRASDKLYLLLHKSNIEALRLNEELSGYHWWLIQDYWTTSNGLLDLFFRPKSIKPEDVRNFNGHVVLLQKGLEQQYTCGDRIDVETFISNFSGKSLSGTLKWTLADVNGQTVAQGNIETVHVEEGTLKSPGKFSYATNDVEQPTRFTLVFEFVDANGSVLYKNNWTTWVYPKEIAPVTDRPIYAEESILPFFPKEWNVQKLTFDADSLPDNAVYAVVWVTPEVLEAVKKGAGLLHFNGNQFLPFISTRYQQTWWKAGDNESSNHCGHYVYDNPITREIVLDNWCDAQWAKILDGAQKFTLDNTEARPQIFIRALTSLVLVHDAAFLFEVGLGKGKMIVSGLKHENAADSPLNRWLLAKMIDEVASDAPAGVSWDTIIPPVRVPEGTVLGIQRLLYEAESSLWYSYRKDDELNFLCRQSKTENKLVWQTGKVTKNDEKVCFIFAGGLGYSGQPKTEGFMLAMNDKDLLKFDLPDNGERIWKSENGNAELRFDMRRDCGQDLFGIFYLTVDRELIRPDTVQTISVRSLGTGSARWFSINLYTDFPDVTDN